MCCRKLVLLPFQRKVGMTRSRRLFLVSPHHKSHEPGTLHSYYFTEVWIIRRVPDAIADFKARVLVVQKEMVALRTALRRRASAARTIDLRSKRCAVQRSRISPTRVRRNPSYSNRIDCTAALHGTRHSEPAPRKPSRGSLPPAPQRPPGHPELLGFERSLQSVLRELPIDRVCFLHPTRLPILWLLAVR